jgi:hypothetical protein
MLDRLTPVRILTWDIEKADDREPLRDLRFLSESIPHLSGLLDGSLEAYPWFSASIRVVMMRRERNAYPKESSYRQNLATVNVVAIIVLSGDFNTIHNHLRIGKL